MPPANPINSSIAEPADVSLGSSLCTECGLCCTGALHNFAVLEPEETDIARGMGFTLRTVGKPGFALPCPKLNGTYCSIYGERPKVCKRYRCALLNGLEDGSIGFDDAATAVAGARRLFDQVHSLLPDGMTIPMARAEFEAPPSVGNAAGNRSSNMRLKLAITALSLFLDRHFRKSSEQNLLAFEAIADQRPDTEMR